MLTSWHQRAVAFLESGPPLHKKILEGGFWAVVVKGLSMPLNLAVVGLLARLLSVDDMGIYYLAFSLVVAASNLAMLGMGQTMVRIVASSIAVGDHEAASSTVRQSFAWGLLGAALAAIVMYAFGSRFGLPVSVVLWVSAWAVAQTGQNLLAEAMRGFSDIRFATIFQNRSLNNIVLISILVLLWVFGGEAELNLILTLIAFTGFGTVGFGLLLLWKKLKSQSTVRKESVRETSRRDSLGILSEALPVFGVNAMSIVRAQIGIWITGLLLSNEEVALYGSATRLVYLVSVPLGTIVNALIPPIIAELYAKEKMVELERTVRGLATLASLVAFTLTVIFVAAGNHILEFVFGEFYVGAWLILGILAVSQLMDVVSGSCGITLTMTGHQTTLMKVTMISAVLAVLSTVVGASLWGLLGVAIATAITLVVQNVLTVVSVKKKVGIWTHVKLSLR